MEFIYDLPAKQTKNNLKKRRIPMDFLTLTIGKQKNIALIAHDSKKHEMIDWCEANKEKLPRKKVQTSKSGLHLLLTANIQPQPPTNLLYRIRRRVVRHT